VARLLPDAGVMRNHPPIKETGIDVARPIGCMKFPPVGKGDFSPGIGKTGFEPRGPTLWGEWSQERNEETVMHAHVENKTGLQLFMSFKR